MCQHVGLQHIQIEITARGVSPLHEHREAIPTAGQKAADGHPYFGGVLQRLAMQGHLADARASGLRQVVPVAKSFRHRQHPRGLRRAGAAGKLLLQHRADLRAGVRAHHDVVAKGLNAEKLPIAQLALRIRHQISPQATGVHERELGTALLRRAGRGQLGICHQIAQSAFQRFVAHAQQRRAGPAHGPLRQGFGGSLVARHQLLHERVGRIGRYGSVQGHQPLAAGKCLALHDVVVGSFAHYLAGGSVHPQ